DQDAGERQAGRVVLDELHVLERRAGPVGQRHPVAGLDRGRRWERGTPPPAAIPPAPPMIVSIRPDISSSATTPQTRPSSTTSRLVYHSSYRVMLGDFSEVWKSVGRRGEPGL